MENNDTTRIFSIEFPTIPSGSAFYFNTDSEIRYEVRFGRMQNNILHASIVFGVLNDEFGGEEYTTTNRGEVYKVMATISEIVRFFMRAHPKINTYEFNAIDNEQQEVEHINARMYLYRRYLPQIFDDTWNINSTGNNAIVSKK